MCTRKLRPARPCSLDHLTTRSVNAGDCDGPRVTCTAVPPTPAVVPFGDMVNWTSREDERHLADFKYQVPKLTLCLQSLEPTEEILRWLSFSLPVDRLFRKLYAAIRRS